MFSGGRIILLANSLCSLNNLETSRNDNILSFDFSKISLILVFGFCKIKLLTNSLFLFIISEVLGNGVLFVSLAAILGAAIADKTVVERVIVCFRPSLRLSCFGVLLTVFIKYAPAKPDNI